VKYAIFRRDRRAQLLVDDSTSFRAVLVPCHQDITPVQLQEAEDRQEAVPLAD